MQETAIARRDFLRIAAASLTASLSAPPVASAEEARQEPDQLQRDLLAHEELLSHQTSAGRLWQSFRRHIAPHVDFDINTITVARQDLAVEGGALGRLDALIDRPRYALMEPIQWLERLRKGKSVFMMAALHEETHLWTDHHAAADPFFDMLRAHAVFGQLRAMAHGEAITVEVKVLAESPEAAGEQAWPEDKLFICFSSTEAEAGLKRFHPASPHCRFLFDFGNKYLPDAHRQLFMTSQAAVPMNAVETLIQEAAGLYGGWEEQMRVGGIALFEMLAHFQLHSFDYTSLNEASFAAAVQKAVADNIRPFWGDVAVESIPAAYSAVVRTYALESLAAGTVGQRHARTCRDIGQALLSYDVQGKQYAAVEERLELLRTTYGVSEVRLGEIEADFLPSLLKDRRADQDIIAKSTKRLFPG